MSARDKGILCMVDIIRRLLTKRLHSRKLAASKWKRDVGPRVLKIIEKRKQLHSGFDCMSCGECKYEVTNGDERVEVDLNLKTCICKLWQLSGIPCKHAIAVILKRREKIEDYVYALMKKDAYMTAYSGVLSPIPDKRFWKEAPGYKLAPPLWFKKAGRPKKKRLRGSNEFERASKVVHLPDGTCEKSFTIKGRAQQCRNCWKWGHNKRSCQSPPIPKPPTSVPSSSSMPPPSKPSSSSLPLPQITSPLFSSSSQPLPQPSTLHTPQAPSLSSTPEQIHSSSQPILGAVSANFGAGTSGGGRARGRGRGRGRVRGSWRARVRETVAGDGTTHESLTQ